MHDLEIPLLLTLFYSLVDVDVGSRVGFYGLPCDLDFSLKPGCTCGSGCRLGSVSVHFWACRGCMGVAGG